MELSPYLQRLAECETKNPLTRAILFVLARGGDCDPAELLAFMKQGETHPERVSVHLANLAGVLQLNTLGRLVVMPPAQWPLRQTRRMPVSAQMGLPTKDDLVDIIARSTPPPVASTPPVAGETFTFRRSNVPDPKRETSKRPEALRDQVRDFVGSRDYAAYWAHPRNDPLFEADSETLAGTLRYCIAREQEGTKPIGNRGKYLWSLFQEFRRQRQQEALR